MPLCVGVADDVVVVGFVVVDVDLVLVVAVVLETPTCTRTGCLARILEASKITRLHLHNSRTRQRTHLCSSIHSLRERRSKRTAGLS